MQDNQEVKEDKNTTDIWNPLMQRYEPATNEFNLNDKNNINNLWCDYVALMFEKYRDEFEKTKINIPFIMAKIFKKNGITIDGADQDSVYLAFDKIIQDQKHIEDYLKKQRSKYSSNMPF